MKLNNRQVATLAHSIMIATNLTDRASEGTITREEFVKTLKHLEATYHGLNEEFLRSKQYDAG
jgi:hypothetical protein